MKAKGVVVIAPHRQNVIGGGGAELCLGYTCFTMLRARDLQRKDGQWTRGKGFDTFAL
jgi:2-keto-4-pentenoate hydratase/2-oxohepta-3-ene-1,7-dioic acid hydratase in catechol pathway